ncbi:hypothetical protein GN958_ATG12740 [Phytophthora infestans]|uniref:Uncharacterized protein n=1 Tax=Phytophthora infestans TaxID=4787 RepID=A0A8S9UBJ5_PHYIN|nr:hypothetical protein GN958_ATG12740 [Phytophthora infestans]
MEHDSASPVPGVLVFQSSAPNENPSLGLLPSPISAGSRIASLCKQVSNLSAGLRRQEHLANGMEWRVPRTQQGKCRRREACKCGGDWAHREENQAQELLPWLPELVSTAN